MSDTIRILILEDDDFEASILKESLEAQNFTTDRASTLHEALEMFAAKNFDFLIIDIYIHGRHEGITFAKTVAKDTSQSIPFLFLTGSSDRSVFEAAKITNPYGFLLKPFNEQELAYTIELILEKNNARKNDLSNIETPFFFKKQNVFYKVTQNDIIYIEVEGRYCNIHTATNSFISQISLKDFLNILSPSTFIKVHRNYVINCNMIKEVHPNDNLIILQNDKTITLGRAYKAAFFDKYKIIK
ncbi:LytR/AlgR family response regulator transcription factor [Kordia sp.]|uniref:LytR/AlgR family response regulator transcription factor n=1 Tax=Kordia sp. TaxID=1965332 RepID=UPI003D6BA637